MKVRVLAKGQCGNSGYSQVASYTGGTTPGAPLSLTGGANSGTSIQLQWQQPSSDGCSPVIDYKVYYKLNDCCSQCGSGSNTFTNTITNNNIVGFSALAQSANSGTFLTVQQLGSGLTVQDGSSYSFVVQARNQYGYGPYSQVVTITAAQAPSAPYNAKVNSISSAVMQVSWSRPTERWNTVTNYFVNVITSNNQKLESACLFRNTLDLSCVIVLDSLRASPFNIGNNQQFSL